MKTVRPQKIKVTPQPPFNVWASGSPAEIAVKVRGDLGCLPGQGGRSKSPVSVKDGDLSIRLRPQKVGAKLA